MLRSVASPEGNAHLDVSCAEGNAHLDVSCAKYKMCWVKVSFCLDAVLLGKSCVSLTKSLA